jgi:hypothetical protein
MFFSLLANLFQNVWSNFGAKIFLPSPCTTLMIRQLVMQIGGVIQGR